MNNPVVESAAACLIGVGVEERGLTPPLLLPLAVFSILPISDSKSDSLSLLSSAFLFDEESSKLLLWNSVTKFSRVLGQRFSLLERRVGDMKTVLVLVLTSGIEIFSPRFMFCFDRCKHDDANSTFRRENSNHRQRFPRKIVTGTLRHDSCAAEPLLQINNNLPNATPLPHILQQL